MTDVCARDGRVK